MFCVLFSGTGLAVLVVGMRMDQAESSYADKTSETYMETELTANL
jgi:hypothetical protein